MTSTQKPDFIYKILPLTEDTAESPLQRSHILPTTSLDHDSGFIHFATSAQVPYVLNRFFNTPDTSTVWLVKIDYEALAAEGDLRWEEAGKGGSLFAHLYGGEVTAEKVCDMLKLDRGPDGWDSVLQKLTARDWLV
ncbi:MAG: hypothetical protein Q9193_004202 [Seirophora villosa]